jgi:TctA family transporter
LPPFCAFRFAAIAPMIVVSCAIGAFAIQNAMFDVWLMLLFGVVGYVFKKIGIPLAPFTLALVLGNRSEDAFRLAMIGAGGDLRVFWSNGLVGSITTLAFILLFWPLIGRIIEGRDASCARSRLMRVILRAVAAVCVRRSPAGCTDARADSG